MLVGVRSNRASRYGKCSALPTSPHLRGRPRTIVQRRDTLTPHLVQDIAPVPLSPDSTVESIHLPLSDCRRHPTSPKRSRYEHIARLQRSLEDIGRSRQHDDGGVRPQLSHFDRTLLAVIWGITSSTITISSEWTEASSNPFLPLGGVRTAYPKHSRTAFFAFQQILIIVDTENGLVLSHRWNVDCVWVDHRPQCQRR